ncbi:hypothetical protein DFH07DRAFT_840159 [Mycena maculata]|uniref:Uncharacterized protein n=1 Tax=Mycena maculata TaxID=230809 RepID=A0AAD7MZS0_9AGAR|nr:hypothetical protein DFH07DRAFT_840159 [Mycena maculata]
MQIQFFTTSWLVAIAVCALGASAGPINSTSLASAASSVSTAPATSSTASANSSATVSSPPIAHTGSAQINANITIGTFQNGSKAETVAWAGGNHCGGGLLQQVFEAPVTSVVLQEPGNFCDINFPLMGLAGIFVFKGCGGPLWVDRDGSFYANCVSYSGNSTNCLLTEAYVCVP